MIRSRKHDFAVFLAAVTWAMWLVMGGVSWGATWYVQKSDHTPNMVMKKSGDWPLVYNGSGVTDNTDIDAVIAASSNGDTVVLDGGTSGLTYSGTELDSDSNITLGKAVTLRGVSSSDPNYTIHNGNVTLDGGSNDVNIIYNNVSGSTYSNFTIIGGLASGTKNQFRTDYPCTLRNITFYNGRTALYLYSGNGINIENCKISQSSSSNSYAVNIVANANAPIFNNCIFNNCLAIFSGATTVYHTSVGGLYNNCEWINTSGPAVHSNAASGTIVVNNPILSSTANSYNYPLYESGSGSIVVNNPIISGAVVSYGRVSSGDVTINNPIYSSAKFISSSYPGVLIFGVDDATNLSYFQSVASKLESYGWVGTYAFSSPIGWAGDWNNMAALVSSGHDIAAHGQSFGSGMTDLSGIRINYGSSCGSGATVSISSTGNVATSLTTSINGTQDKNISITSSMTLAQLVSAIGGSGYTVSELNAASGDPLAKYLADANNVNMCATNADLPLLGERVYNGEMTATKTAIELGLSSVGSSYTVNTWVSPGNDTSSDLRSALYDRGFVGSRGSATGSPNSISSVNIYDIRSVSLETLLGSEDPTQQDVSIRLHGLTEYLKNNGGVAFLFAHNTTGTDGLSLDGWDKVLSETKLSGILVLSLKQAVEYLKTYNPSGDLATSDSMTYTRTLIDHSDFHLQPSSPAINAGTNICTGTDAPLVGCTGSGTGTWTDYDGRWLVGAPDIGAYEYQPTQVVWWKRAAAYMQAAINSVIDYVSDYLADYDGNAVVGYE